MRKLLNRSILAILMAAFIMGSTSCIGSFSLTNRLLGWNKHVGNKFINELVFFAFWVLPVYEVTGLADLLVLNSIEFWSGRNPIGDTAQADRVVESSAGDRLLVKTDAEGYDIVNLDTEESCRLSYNPEIDGWTIEQDGSSSVLFTFVDDTHIRVPVEGADQWMTVELSQHGLLAYAAAATPTLMAAK